MNCAGVGRASEHGVCNASAEIVRFCICSLDVARQPEREACAVVKTVADCRVSYFFPFFSLQNQQQYQIVDLSPQQVQAMMQQQQGMGAMGMARQSFAPQQQMMQRPQQQMQVVDLSPQQVQQMMAQQQQFH